VEIETCRRLFATADVARLATIGDTGPHLVPIVFATDGDQVFSAVDHKPKSSRRLQRLANIAANPTVSLLVDHYEDDWNRLWWVRADGTATIVDEPDAMAHGLDLLAAKYSQYEQIRQGGPLIEVAVTSWTGWSAS
jgi:PPOX class probable F420-dependent enzyme